MYDDSMQAIHDNLIETSKSGKLLYTLEIHPKRLAHNNQMCVCLALHTFILRMSLTLTPPRAGRGSVPSSKTTLCASSADRSC